VDRFLKSAKASDRLRAAASCLLATALFPGMEPEGLIMQKYFGQLIDQLVERNRAIAEHEGR